ncbi:hypothetical protein [Auritidibacter ignavus]|uniref:hypothetical protein n=1 Tax=Auritidibacter ignavus TaxID=678932 RepID=UPI0024490BC2|nr:hypothetical protein [Auritidibacter ignavus]WGH86216.1 hypothetical protein QDX24_11835 [Auritidibacter ignavus]WGH88500.1 hypothetical protein QDX22_11835 [Auritidibacter ignavus]
MSPRNHAIPDLTDEFDETDEYVLPDYRDPEAIPELSGSQLEQMLSVATNPETPEPEDELVPDDAVPEHDLDADMANSADLWSEEDVSDPQL